MGRQMYAISLSLTAGLIFCGCQEVGRERKTGMDVVKKPWPVWTVTFSPDGRWLAAGRGYRSQTKFWLGGRGEVNVWHVEDWKQQDGFSGQFTFWVEAVAFTPDSKNLIAASDKYIQSDPKTGGPVVGTPNPWDGNEVFIWAVPDGTLTRRLHIKAGGGSMRSLAVSPDGKFLAFGRGNTVPVLQIKTGQEIYELKDIIRWVDFSPDGKILAATSGSPSVHLYDAATGKKRVDFDMPGKELSLTCLRFSPDGKQIATGVSDGSVHLLAADLTKQLQLLEVSAEKEKVQTIAYAAKADLMAAATTSRVRLFEASSGKQLQEWGKPDLKVQAVALSPDGKFLVVGYGGKHNAKGERRGGFVIIWDTATGRLVKKLD